MFLAIRKIVVHLHVAIFSEVCLVNRSAVGDRWWLLRGSKEGLCIERIGKCAEQPGTHGAAAAESELYNPRLSKDIPYSIISFYLQKKKGLKTLQYVWTVAGKMHIYTPEKADMVE